MAAIELVIKIPEGLKNDFEMEQWTALSCMEIKDVLMNGTPLPKGHGDLIDRSQILTVTDFMEDGTERCYVLYEHIEEAETIIEADKGEQE